ncbi:1458_t:CDS:2 [Dentiscutata erythropus]|uniref:1458_t:CDS:1 n=1 Tax=Dentiscutata erythropus TaxID=1348616 RepID=A0A9N9DKK1_9GLOM|nr:1458_t:CDS:2 [Dentiscutata erythropus]
MISLFEYGVDNHIYKFKVSIIKKWFAIIGAGSVGAFIAFALHLQKISSEILLVDINPEAVEGQVLDLSDANFISSTQVRSGTFQEAGQCDIVVITAGAKQKSGETRVELIERNYKILDNVIGSMKPFNPNIILLLVANPSSAHVGGKPLLDFPKIQKLDKEVVAKEIANKAYKIIELKGATYFGIAGCVSIMPVVLGSDGVERIIEISLSEEEKNNLRRSASALKSICAKYL